MDESNLPGEGGMKGSIEGMVCPKTQTLHLAWLTQKTARGPEMPLQGTGGGMTGRRLA